MEEILLKYRRKVVTESGAKEIQKLIDDHPELSRKKLSFLLCEVWDWKQPNGHPKDMVCRGLMLALHRAGHITLPPIRKKMPNPFLNRKKPVGEVDIDSTPLETPLKELLPLRIEQVRRTKHEKDFGILMEKHHYIGYTQPVGEQLKYMIFSGDRPIALMAWSSAPRHLDSRDQYIGWSQQCRKDNIHFLAYNTRFLILPWVKVPHLASHILGKISRRISNDWNTVYNHPIHFLETFIDPEKFKGTCYKAAGWKVLGETLGLGKDSKDKIQNRSIKYLLAKTLTPKFREILCQEQCA